MSATFEDKRRDFATRALVDQALEFKATLGVKIAVSFLLEHRVASALVYRILLGR